MAGRAPVVPGTNKAGGKPREQQISEDVQTDLKERIRLRAHEIWLRRGREGSSELDDWLEAEREVLAQQQLKKDA